VEAAQFAKAMGHPARIRIVTLLLESEGELNCGALTERIPLAQSTVSQHLKELLAAGILEVSQVGTACLYRLNRSELLNFCQSFQIALGNDPRKFNK
jgi:ArsR family transcriptional regulator